MVQRPLSKSIRKWEEETGLEWPPSDMLERFHPVAGAQAARALVGITEPAARGVDKKDSAEEVTKKRHIIQEDLLEAMEPTLFIPMKDIPIRGYPRIGSRDPAYALYRKEYRRGHMLGMYTDCHAPDIVNVNREARFVVEERFSKMFETLGGEGRGIWFDPERDWLYLRHDSFGHYFKNQGNRGVVEGVVGFFGVGEEDRKRVRTVAISFGTEDDDEGEEWVVALIRAFPGARELKMVPYHTVGEGDDQSELYFEKIFPVERFVGIYTEVRDGREAEGDMKLERFGALPTEENLKELDELGVEMLGELTERLEAEWGMKDLPLENIEHVVSMTGGAKRDLDKAKEIYYRLKSQEQKGREESEGNSSSMSPQVDPLDDIQLVTFELDSDLDADNSGLLEHLEY